MRLREEQAADLRLWATERLEGLTETDPKILADYAVQLLNGDNHIEEVRKAVVAGLEDFLLENTAQFVAELFVKATLHPRPPISAPSAPAVLRLVIRNPVPITQAKPPLRSAAPLSSAPPGPRKRNYAQAYGYEDYAHHIGRHQVTKRGRGNGNIDNGITRGDSRGRGRHLLAMTGGNAQPVGLGIGTAAFNLPKPPTPPRGMVAKKGKCEYFDVHGYCMRGDACPYKHTKQTPDIEARHEVGGYASDTERAGGVFRKKAQFTRRLPSMANTSTMRNACRTLSYEVCPTPDGSDEPKKPQETELNIEAFKAEQIIKRQDHKTRVATLKDNQSQMETLAREAAEMEVKLAAEKANLMAKPGGDKILAQISAESKRNSKLGIAGLTQRAVDDGTEADMMSLEGTPDPRPRRLSSVLSDTGGYKGKNQANCNFFPNCTNPICTFKHTADSPAAVMLCKFFPNCTNRDCTFKHTTASPTSEVLCKFFPNCTKQDCTFKHPPATQPQTSNANTTRTAPSPHAHSSTATAAWPTSTASTTRTAPTPAAASDTQRAALARAGSSGWIIVRGICSSRGEEAHDGLVVTFVERWQAEEVRRRLTMVGGVGRVKCAWYLGRVDRERGVGETPRTELEVDVESLGGGDGAVKMDDVKMDEVRIKDEDLDVAGEDDEWAHIS